MSRTHGRRVASGHRLISLRKGRGRTLGSAVANAVEGLEQRWMLDGLQGTYYEAPGNLNYDRNVVIYSNRVGARIDPLINFIAQGAGGNQDPNGGGAFNGANGANQRIAGTGLADDQYFTARWEGTYTVPGTVGGPAVNTVFYTRSDDGVRLWVNGNKVIDQWNANRDFPVAPGDTSPSIPLAPGTQVPILLEFNQGNGGAGVALYVQDDSGTFTGPTIIPTASLNSAVAKPTAPSGLTAPVPQTTPFSVELDWNDNSNNEAYYRVEESTNGGTTWTTLRKVTPPNAATGAMKYSVGGLSPATTYQFRVVAENFATPAEDPTTTTGPITVTTLPAPVAQAGLIGQYFEAPNNVNYNRDAVSGGTRVGTRIDPQIDFLDDAGGAFNGALQNNRIDGTGLADDQFFTARWEGQLVVTTDDNYTFFTRSDDGIRLLVNGNLAIDHWNDDRGVPGLPGDTSAPMHLAPGSYPILAEFNQGVGGAGAGVYWQSDLNATETIIPSANLNTNVVIPQAADNIAVAAVHGVTVDLTWQDHSNNEARFRIEKSTDNGVTWTKAIAAAPHTGATGVATATVTGLTSLTNYRFRVIAYNYAGDSATVPASATSAQVNSGTASGPGAIAQYFNIAGQNGTGNPFFTNDQPALTRIDQTINFDFGNGSPDPVIGADDFSGRWSGKLHIVTGGTYTFSINSDDGGFAWVNGQEVSDYSGLHGAGDVAANFPITLAPGDYPFVVAFAERGGGALARFYYNGPDSGNARVIVPAQGAAGTPGMFINTDLPTAVTNLVAATRTPTSLTVNWNDVALNEYAERLEMSSDGGTTWNVLKKFDVVTNVGGLATPESFTVNNLTPNTAYKFRVIDSNSAGDTTVNLDTSTLAVPSGAITVTGPTASSGDTNLTSEGTLDWRHWGLGGNATATNDRVPGFNPDALILQGESATSFTAGGFQIISDNSFSGGKALQATTGNTGGIGNAVATWTFNIIDPGDYQLYVRRRVAGGGDNSIYRPPALDIAQNATAVGGTQWDNREAPLTNVLIWTGSDGITPNVAEFAPYTANNPITYTGVTPGAHTLTIATREAGYVIDEVALIRTDVAGTLTPLNHTQQEAFLNSLGVQGGNPISNFTSVGAGTPTATTTPGKTFTWNNGAPTVAATATADAVAVTGTGNGFHFTAPATTSLRRLKVYVAYDGAGAGTLTATMSDGSVTPPVIGTLTDTNASGPTTAVYTFDYRSGLANQTINLDWVASGGGTAILSAADFIEIQAPAAPGQVVVTPTGKGKLNVAWPDNSGNETGFLVERAPDAGGSPGTFTTLTTTGPNVNQYLDSGLADGAKFFYRVTALGLIGNTPATGTPASGTTLTNLNRGVRVRFWNDPNGVNNAFHYGVNGDAPVKVRTDLIPATQGNINYDWGTGVPDPAVGADNFSSQWDATYTADYTGPTTFFTSSDDGGRFLIDLNQDGIFEYDPAAAIIFNTTPGAELVVNSYVDQGLGLDSVNNGRGIVVNLVAGQQYKIRVQQYEHGGGAGIKLFFATPFSGQAVVPAENLDPGDITPPKVTSTEVDRKLPATATYTANQHIVFHFSEAIGPVNTSGITVSQLLDGGGIGSVYSTTELAWTFDAASNSGILTFPGVPNQELPDGNYKVTLSAAGITDTDGNGLDGNGDGTGGDDFNFNFYILKGDTQAAYNGNFNGDRKISFIEYQRLELNYGKTSADRVSAAEGDSNHDGVIDDTDVKWFFDHNGNTLAPPAPSSPVGAPAPAPVPVTTTTTTTKKLTKPAPKPAPKPVAKPVTKPVLVVAPPKSTFATKKITSVKDLLSGH